MKDNMHTHLLVYDESCSFCTSVKKAVEKKDQHKKFNYIPYQKYSLKRDSKLVRNNCTFELLVMAPDGHYYTGFFAFRRIVRFLPGYKTFAFLLFIPFVPSLGKYIYKVIAQNKKCMARNFCSLRV